MDTVDLFYSYSHKDEPLRDELDTHLALLKRRGVLRTWHDRRIGAGQDWAATIDANLESADIILLLISPDFIASDYCYEREMIRAIDRHKAGQARVIPVIARAIDLEGAPFAALQALPKDAKPVTTWPNRDEAWTDVAKGIRKVAEELRVSHAPRSTDDALGGHPRDAVPDPRAARALERALAGFEQQVASAMSQRQLQSELQPDKTRQAAERLAAVPDQKRVLWVDDHPENNASESSALRRLQIEVDACVSTAAALTSLRTAMEPYHLVISDWERFPRRIPWQPEGLRLLRKMRKDGIATPVLFYHGVVEPDVLLKRRQQVASGKGQGATFRPDELLDQVVQLLATLLPVPERVAGPR